MSRIKFNVIKHCGAPECEKYYIQTDEGERLGLLNAEEQSAQSMICRDKERAHMLCDFLNRIATPTDELN